MIAIASMGIEREKTCDNLGAEKEINKRTKQTMRQTGRQTDRHKNKTERHKENLRGESLGVS